MQRIIRKEAARLFDILTIAAVADELVGTLLDGRIQRIGLVDPFTLAAEVYAGGRRRTLVASADPRQPRLFLSDAAPSLDPSLVTPFVLLLRKYVRGGILIGVDQPPLERLVRLSIAKRLRPHNGPRPRYADAAIGEAETAEPEDVEQLDDEEDALDATFVHLAVEIMGRHSNLILVDDEGRIMESVKRVTPAMSRVRPILPRLPYTPPPAVEKRDPRRITASEAAHLLASAPPATELAPWLVRMFRAVSPQMAREIAYRTAADAAVTVGALELDAEAPARLARETRALLEPLLTAAWAPHVYREDDMVVAFSAVAMAHLAAVATPEATPTISAAIALALAAEAAPAGRHAQRRARLVQAIQDARQRLEQRLTSLRAQAAKAAEAERLRDYGELIYAWLWQIKPGQTALEVDGTTVPLDPSLSPKENAQAYFERYRKARGAEAQLPELIAATEEEAAYLDQLTTLTEQAAGFAEIEALTHEWEAHRPAGQAAAPGKVGKTRAAAKRPRPLRDHQGNAVYVGHTGRENDLITFDLAGPDDTWLHARGVPGSHVVVRWQTPGGQEVPETIAAAAALAAYYSAGRASGRAEVDVARRRFVRKIKGAGPGMVTYRNERTIAVHPADEAGVAETLWASASG